MPKWMHDRADHLMEKNPSMPKSEAFAIATQQMHAAGKSPKGYGTSEGRHEARQKYDEPKKNYEQRADPGGLAKTAEFVSEEMAAGFIDELRKIAMMTPPAPPAPTAAPSMTEVRPTSPKKPGSTKIPTYTKVNTEGVPSPSAQMQPLAESPPARK